MSTAMKYAIECDGDYQHYRAKCRNTFRGDGVHDLWVKLAWMNRCQKREWLSIARSL